MVVTFFIFHFQIGAQVFETSSKTGENVEKLFEQVVRDFASVVATLRDSFPLEESDEPKRKCC